VSSAPTSFSHFGVPSAKPRCPAGAPQVGEAHHENLVRRWSSVSCPRPHHAHVGGFWHDGPARSPLDSSKPGRQQLGASPRPPSIGPAGHGHRSKCWVAMPDSSHEPNSNFNSFSNSRSSLNPIETSKIHSKFICHPQIMKLVLLFI
jgi:hypothetical protein